MKARKIDYSEMLTGRLKKLVDDFAPQMNWSPIGLAASILGVYSAVACDTSVRRGSGSLKLPLQIVLVGESGQGKGQVWKIAREIAEDADPSFIANHLITGATGGKGLVVEIATRDGQALVFDSEWQRILKSGRSNATLSSNIRNLADSDTVTAGTGKDKTEVRDPHVAFLGHVQPTVFAQCMNKTDLDGGSYNRQIFIPVQREQWLSERHVMPENLTSEAGEMFAAAIRHARRTEYLDLTDEAFDAADQMEPQIMAKVTSAEALKPFSARVIEHIRRVAGLMTLFDLRTEVTAQDLKAARAFVEFSFEPVERIANGGGPVKTLSTYIREHLARRGGVATRTVLLRALGTRATAETLMEMAEQMPDIEITEDKGARGRPAVVFRLLDKDPDDEHDEELAEVHELPVQRSKPAVVAIEAEAEEAEPVQVDESEDDQEPDEQPEPRKLDGKPGHVPSGPFAVLI
ncbi:DUF3987 domain-containing protein [Streptomyces sp. 769]|uniref:DUF3987 domain-containing protein n=1 Tax=Streptomyces sp. 769 TaxID=1262452 RepID=UPI00057E6364|nr:DUF3987 domain-containing protein [Streptomyces sp. 769]AJC54015.1 hypothetical protein GZL_01415 [Streptomyces sp. 769]